MDGKPERLERQIKKYHHHHHHVSVMELDHLLTRSGLTSRVFRVYRSNEIDNDHYLLCAEVNLPPRWLNRSNKKVPLKQEEFFKVRLLNDENMRVKLHLNNIKENEIDIEKE